MCLETESLYTLTQSDWDQSFIFSPQKTIPDLRCFHLSCLLSAVFSDFMSIGLQEKLGADRLLSGWVRQKLGSRRKTRCPRRCSTWFWISNYIIHFIFSFYPFFLLCSFCDVVYLNVTNEVILCMV